MPLLDDRLFFLCCDGLENRFFKLSCDGLGDQNLRLFFDLGKIEGKDH